jgi:hypothetical protein
LDHRRLPRVNTSPGGAVVGSACRRRKVVMPLDLSDLLGMREQELEDLFRANAAGEIRDGDADGIVVIAPGTDVSRIASFLIRLIAWRGKVFNGQEGDLRNKVGPFGWKLVRAKVYKDASWFDGEETIVLDYSKTSFIASRIRDEIREIAPGVYLGLVFWGRKKVAMFALKFST